MPELRRFYGIDIRMYFTDHPSPHFHAVHSEHKALIAIDDFQIITAILSRDEQRLIELGGLFGSKLGRVRKLRFWLKPLSMEFFNQ